MKDWYKEHIYLTNDHHEVRQGDWISDTDGDTYGMDRFAIHRCSYQ